MVTWILLMHVIQVVEHVIGLKTSFLQNDLLSAISCIVVPCFKIWVACEYIQITHWLATSYLIGQA